MPDDEGIVERETAAAEREAAEIGGRADATRDPARAPVEEAGGGEADHVESTQVEGDEAGN